MMDKSLFVSITTKMRHDLMCKLYEDLDKLFEDVTLHCPELLNKPHFCHASFIYVVEHVIPKHYSIWADDTLLNCILDLIKLKEQPK